MIEQTQRPQSTRGPWMWLPVLLLLLVQVRFSIFADVAPLLRLALMLPVVSAWLGARYGRRALGPILAVLPLMLMTIEWDIGNLTIGTAAGASVGLLSVLLAALFAGSKDAPTPQNDSPGAVAALSALSLLTFASAGVAVGDSSGYIDVRLSSPLGEEILALAAFAFVATGRVSPTMATAPTAVVVIALGIVGAAKFESLPTAALSLSGDALSFYIGAGLWAPSAARALAFAAFGILAGSLVARMRSAPLPGLKVSGREAVAVLALTLLAGLAFGSSWTNILPAWAFVDDEAGRVLLAQAGEVIPVCASPRRLWTLGLSPILVGGAALAWGLAWPNAARLWAPAAAAAIRALLTWAGGGSFFYGCESSQLAPVVDIAGPAAIAWTGVWVADMLRASRGASPSPRAEDISELAWTVRRADASATLRAFAVIVVTLTAWIVALDAPIQAARALAEGYALSTPWIILAVAGGLIGLLSPLAFIVIDRLSRRPARRVSGVLAFGYGMLGHAVFAALVLTAAVFVVEAALWGQDDFDFSTAPPQSWAAYALSRIAQQIALLSGLWLTLRASRLEAALAGSVPRAQLLGRIESRGFAPRIAHIVGLPSSLWRASAAASGAFWLFVFARPVVYLGALIALGAAGLTAQLVDFDALLSPFQDSYYSEEAPAAAPEHVADAIAAFGGSPLQGVLLAATAAVVLVLLGHAMFAAAKRLAARRIWAPEKPGAAPVLFLRSFTDDQLAFRRPALDLVGRWLDLWSFRRNVDETLIDEMAQLGDVIALGRPDEKRAPFGAARRYPSHDEWQAAIADAAARARMIVVAAGDTPGLMWEYERIAQGLLGKTIILFAPRPPGDPSTERAARILFEAIPAARVDLQALGGASVALTVVDGTARAMVVAGTPRAEAYVAALRSFSLALSAART